MTTAMPKPESVVAALAQQAPGSPGGWARYVALQSTSKAAGGFFDVSTTQFTRRAWKSFVAQYW